jgi:hypothetical protein
VQNSFRPAVVLQTNAINNYSTTFIIAPITWKVIQFRASQAKQTQARCSESSATLFQPAEPFHCVPDNQNDEEILYQPFLSIFEKLIASFVDLTFSRCGVKQISRTHFGYRFGNNKFHL